MKTIKNLKAEEIRKSILQLAIQGKLVKQDPNDEPASELVKRIYAEKQRLIKEGKIKKDKNESFIFKGDDNCYYEKIGNSDPVKLEDLPFDIPDNWTWIRLTSIATISAGGTPDRGTPKYWNGDIPWLKISDITSANKYVRKASEFITKDGMDNSSAKIMQKGTILYTIFATIGEVGILDFEATCNQAIAGINTHLKELDDYLYFLLVNLKDYMKSISKGCAQFNINQKILKETLIALPPVEEQLRIVEKLDSFNTLLDSYAVAVEKLSTLEDEFPEKLKKSILQYAIEGKLVKQDPNDEPASVLLERIKAEKERLIKEGKIKRDKNESYIYQGDDKNYYENLPSGWTVSTYSGILLEAFGGGTPSKSQPSYWNGDIRWCSVKDLGETLYVYGTVDSITLDGLNNSSANIVKKGNLILCTRMAVGKIRVAGIDMAINQDLKGLVPSTNISKDFLVYQIQSTRFIGTGTTVKGLQFVDFLQHPFLLPPINEQKRIVSKLNTILNELQILSF